MATSSPAKTNNYQRVSSILNFSNFKLQNIKNNIKNGINILSKSSVIINIKDIIGNKNNNIGISTLKSDINKIPEITELKNQKYLNICMFYIQNIKNVPNKYLVYIYLNYKDLYFIYEYGKNSTTIHNIGKLEPFEINDLLKNMISKLGPIKNEMK